jgi:hypothetical protein
MVVVRRNEEAVRAASSLIAYSHLIVMTKYLIT